MACFYDKGDLNKVGIRPDLMVRTYRRSVSGMARAAHTINRSVKLPAGRRWVFFRYRP
jgi:hypothetical protein